MLHRAPWICETGDFKLSTLILQDSWMILYMITDMRLREKCGVRALFNLERISFCLIDVQTGYA